MEVSFLLNDSILNTIFDHQFSFSFVLRSLRTLSLDCSTTVTIPSVHRDILPPPCPVCACAQQVSFQPKKKCQNLSKPAPPFLSPKPLLSKNSPDMCMTLIERTPPPPGGVSYLLMWRCWTRGSANSERDSGSQWAVRVGHTLHLACRRWHVNTKVLILLSVPHFFAPGFFLPDDLWEKYLQ